MPEVQSLLEHIDIHVGFRHSSSARIDGSAKRLAEDRIRVAPEKHLDTSGRPAIGFERKRPGNALRRGGERAPRDRHHGCGRVAILFS